MAKCPKCGGPTQNEPREFKGITYMNTVCINPACKNYFTILPNAPIHRAREVDPF